VDKCILSLKSGKAPDYDGLTAEHLQYAHPCLGLTIIISRLFELILAYRVVSDGFGFGPSHPIHPQIGQQNKFSDCWWFPNYNNLSDYLKKIWVVYIF